VIGEATADLFEARVVLGHQHRARLLEALRLRREAEHDLVHRDRRVVLAGDDRARVLGLLGRQRHLLELVAADVAGLALEVEVGEVLRHDAGLGGDRRPLRRRRREQEVAVLLELLDVQVAEGRPGVALLHQRLDAAAQDGLSGVEHRRDPQRPQRGARLLEAPHPGQVEPADVVEEQTGVGAILADVLVDDGAERVDLRLPGRTYAAGGGRRIGQVLLVVVGEGQDEAQDRDEAVVVTPRIGVT
jgi:hypothetical protein